MAGATTATIAPTMAPATGATENAGLATEAMAVVTAAITIGITTEAREANVETTISTRRSICAAIRTCARRSLVERSSLGWNTTARSAWRRAGS